MPRQQLAVCMIMWGRWHLLLAATGWEQVKGGYKTTYASGLEVAVVWGGQQ